MAGLSSSRSVLEVRCGALRLRDGLQLKGHSGLGLYSTAHRAGEDEYIAVVSSL